MNRMIMMISETDKVQKTERANRRGAGKHSPPARRPARKGGKFFPALCNIIGTLILLAVIAVSLPLALPRFFGYEIYTVVSGSMEPTIPVGSVIYVEPVEEPRDVQVGEIIAFNSNGTVVAHRVVQNQYFYEEFVTKGDANDQEDINPVSYRSLIGRVKQSVPQVGRLMMVYTSRIGKVYLLCLAACGVMFNVLAGRIRVRQRERFQEQLERYDRRQTARMNAEMEKLRR